MAVKLGRKISGIAFCVALVVGGTILETVVSGDWFQSSPAAKPKPTVVRVEQVGDFGEIDVPANLSGFERLAGDAGRGRELFLNRLDCASCHGLQPGEEFGGPSLVSVSARLTAKQIVTSILEPSLEIHPEFREATVVDVAGRTYKGREIAALSNDRTFVLNTEAGPISIARDEIDLLIYGESAMPAGQSDGLTAQDFCDLVAFLVDLR